ncbi:MAG: YggU family protein [Promethearchaeota archaeon]|nr:MAG: YggU family protein [Candidatus Lokiarchaeota archaeon]
MDIFTEKNDSIIMEVYVKPNSKEEKLEWDENTFILQLTASPVKGKANKAIIQFLSNFFRISKNQISIISGLKSKSKKILICELNQDQKNRIRRLVKD